MKTPLSTIWFTLERMRQQSADAGVQFPLQDHVNSVSEEIRRLDRYVKGFMKLANLNPPNLQANDLNAFISDLLSSYRRKLPDSISIQVDLANDLPSVKLDVNLFTAAVINLLDNAVNAMKGKGVLKVSTYLAPTEPGLAQDLENNDVCLAIADTGYQRKTFRKSSLPTSQNRQVERAWGWS
jgi:signal transduction histidine kinase